MTRSVPEWIGNTDDTRVPPRVRQRIFEREGHRCHLSGRVIADGEPWDLDHVQALINGGEHRESNLKPAIRDKHREKTAQDVREKSIINRKQKMASGIRKQRTITRWRKFNGEIVHASRDR